MPEYAGDHAVGDEMTVPAHGFDHEDAADAHDLTLYDPPGSVGVGLKWRCDRCMRIYADPLNFESRPCVPFGRCR
jgi:hypothetical protein